MNKGTKTQGITAELTWLVNRLLIKNIKEKQILFTALASAVGDWIHSLLEYISCTEVRDILFCIMNKPCVGQRC